MSNAENGAGERHLELFLDMMAVERGASANTLAAYRRDLTLASADLDGGLSRADAAALGRLADGWRDLSGATVARKALMRSRVASGSSRTSIAFLALSV